MCMCREWGGKALKIEEEKVGGERGKSSITIVHHLPSPLFHVLSESMKGWGEGKRSGRGE